MNMHDEIFNPDSEVKLLEELDFKCVCVTACHIIHYLG